MTVLPPLWRNSWPGTKSSRKLPICLRRMRDASDTVDSSRSKAGQSTDPMIPRRAGERTRREHESGGRVVGGWAASWGRTSRLGSGECSPSRPTPCACSRLAISRATTRAHRRGLGGAVPSRRARRRGGREGMGRRRRALGRGVLRRDPAPRVPAQLADADERRHGARAARRLLRAAGRGHARERLRGGEGDGGDPPVRRRHRLRLLALRPAGDVVQGTPGVASGPVSFMGVFDAATAVVKQGGRRRGANMGVLRVDHPDVLRVHPRQGDRRAAHQLQHLGGDARSLLAGRRGGRALRPGESAQRQRGAQRRRARAARRDRELAWASGDPGVIFIDAVNRANPTPQLGPLAATNPCGELPLLPNEACNLGSLRLDAFVRDGAIDWDALDARRRSRRALPRRRDRGQPLPDARRSPRPCTATARSGSA